MINKKYIEELAQKLYFRLDDKQVDLIAKDLENLEKQLAVYQQEIDSKSIPADYPRVKNCAVLRKDVVSKSGKKEYLSNAKTFDKYVVGK